MSSCSEVQWTEIPQKWTSYICAPYEIELMFCVRITCPLPPTPTSTLSHTQNGAWAQGSLPPPSLPPQKQAGRCGGAEDIWKLAMNPAMGLPTPQTKGLPARLRGDTAESCFVWKGWKQDYHMDNQSVVEPAFFFFLRSLIKGAKLYTKDMLFKKSLFSLLSLNPQVTVTNSSSMTWPNPSHEGNRSAYSRKQCPS